MALDVQLNDTELLEVDIGDGGESSERGEVGDAPRRDGPWAPRRDGPWAPRRDGPWAPRSSIVDRLLVELYDTYSWDSSTDASGSEAFLGRSNSGSGFLQELQKRHTRRLQVNYLSQKAPEELRSFIQEARYRTGLQSAKLIRQLRRRDRLGHKLQKNYDIITACLQAVSLKRRVDTRLKFTIEPSLGKNGFQQWYDALKAVARLPTGIPKEWRRRVWLTLADQYLHSISIDWDKTLRFAFNERSNPDDDSLGIQIVKDLHRTGCSSYCGQEGEQDRVVLKRVLLAYARWNKSVGYCQGFNVLAALILEVTEGNESDALKVMIYLIDKVLPESYFANNLRALSVDMAVFRDLLRLKLPRLSQHLHHLQKAANREAGGSYEPPLTNVFTMQWFLTMFATCLPAPTVLKIWDSVFFEGSEVLFRVALSIWERLGERIEYCQTADEFYSTMGGLTQEMLEHDLVDSSRLMQEVYSMAVFPFPQLSELREKYTYNITPFPTAVKSNGSDAVGGWESDDDDADMDDEDSLVTALGCLGPLGGLLAPELHRYQRHLKEQRAEQGNMAELSPGAVGAGGGAGGSARADHQAAINGMMMERMSTDIYALKKQYARIKRRQQQQAMQLYIRTGLGQEVTSSSEEVSSKACAGSQSAADDKCPATRVLASQLNPSSSVINHLLLGRRPQRGPPGGHLGPLPPSLSVHGEVCPGSPWRAHVRQHRRNIARARAQLGFADSEEQEEEKGESVTRREEEEEEEEEEKGESVTRREEEEEEEEKGESVTRREEEEEEEEKGESVTRREEEEEEEEKGESVTRREEEEEEEEKGESVTRREEEEEEEEKGESVTRREEEEEEEKTEENGEEEQKEESSSSVAPSPGCSSTDEAGEAELSEVVLQMESLELRPLSSEPAAPIPLLPPPPSSSRHRVSNQSDPEEMVSTIPPPSPPPSLLLCPSSSSVTDLSSAPPPASSTFYRTCSPSTPSLSSMSSSSPPPAASTPKPQTFSPFPCVKQPRKSTAARNLGLYGPTARTPSVHFPQLNRSLSRSSAAGVTGAR